MFLVAFVALAFTLVVMQSDDAVTAERPKGLVYSNSYSMEFLLDTVTNDSTIDTTFKTSGGEHVMLINGLDGYSVISGYITIEVTEVDTTDDGTEYPDTTKDSIAVQWWTDWGDTTYKYAVWKNDDIAPTTSAVTTYFTIPADSILGLRLWPKFTYAIGDTDYTVARDECGFTFKATVKLVAKP